MIHSIIWLLPHPENEYDESDDDETDVGSDIDDSKDSLINVNMNISIDAAVNFKANSRKIWSKIKREKSSRGNTQRRDSRKTNYVGTGTATSPYESKMNMSYIAQIPWGLVQD